MIGKYVIIKGNPILFPNDIKHADVVSVDLEVDSAGFFSITRKAQQQQVICMGESTSLLISSRPEIDQGIISLFLRLTPDKPER